MGNEKDPNRCEYKEGKREWPYVRRCTNDKRPGSRYCVEHEHWIKNG